MEYIEKLDLQTEEVIEVESLDKHTIINDTFSVNKYNRHKREFLPIFYSPFIFSQSKDGIFIYRVGKHTRGRL